MANRSLDNYAKSGGAGQKSTGHNGLIKAGSWLKSRRGTESSLSRVQCSVSHVPCPGLLVCLLISLKWIEKIAVKGVWGFWGIWKKEKGRPELWAS